MKENTKKPQFIKCPVCLGLGKTKNGFSCRSCQGMSVGSFYFSKFLFWGPKMGVAVIELNHFRKRAHLLINFTSFILGFFGLLSLALWFYLTGKSEIELEAFLFWRSQSILILFFWLSLIPSMFVFYRLSEEEIKKHKIKQLNYVESNQRPEIPDNWEELLKIKKKRLIEVSSGYTDKSITLVEDAFLLASKLQHEFVSPMHLFYILLSEVNIATMFTRLNVNAEQIVTKVKNQIEKIEKSSNKTQISPILKEALIESYVNSYEFGVEKVTPKAMIRPLIGKDRMIEEILYDFEIDSEKIANVVKWFIINDYLEMSYKEYARMAKFKPSTNMDRAYTAVATPMLNRISYDMTLAAKWRKLEMCVSREEEIDLIFQEFLSGKSGVLLIGPPGVGKKTIANGIAQLMVRENVPLMFQDKRLLELDIAGIVSGANPAQAEERMIATINEVARAGNIILYLENIENIMGISAGSKESLDLSEVLATALDRHALFCIASVTKQNYIKYIEGSPLDHVTGNVDIDEPEGNKAIQIIESKITALEGRYGVYFSYNAIEQVVNLSKRLIHDRYLPEKAINILNSVAVKVAKEKGKNSIVSKEDIAEVISKITKIPITKIGMNERKSLLNLEKMIHERMVDQEEAVNMVSSSLRRARANLREGKRPIANFLFAGPTGVGKTELAKAVSEIYFGSEEYMIRIDMSEYQHPGSVEKMIGSPDGIQGHLTEMVRRAPFSLILLDEFEKAHPDILNLFLQVMDDGRLTDGQGRTIDFTNSIIIATSNAGAMYIQKAIKEGSSVETIKENLINEHLNQVMRPELINRFDGVVVFKPLSLDDVENITKLMLGKTKKLLDKKGIGFRFSDEGVKKLAKLGYDPKFGARPLRRLLQDKIDNQIANFILGGDLIRRDIVYIDEMAEVKIEKRKEI